VQIFGVKPTVRVPSAEKWPPSRRRRFIAWVVELGLLECEGGCGGTRRFEVEDNWRALLKALGDQRSSHASAQWRQGDSGAATKETTTAGRAALGVG